MMHSIGNVMAVVQEFVVDLFPQKTFEYNVSEQLLLEFGFWWMKGIPMVGSRTTC